jgi:hypothetical protein
MMKKILLMAAAVFCVILLINCNSTKKAMAAKPKATFENDVKPLIVANCTPCHIPDKGGRKKAYDAFAPVLTDIDNIISRIEMHPGDRGFMPFKKERLSDSTINVFKQWKTDGLLEK